MLNRTDGVIQNVPVLQGAVVGGLDDWAVEEGCVMGEADLEQVGSGLREAVEVVLLGAL